MNFNSRETYLAALVEWKANHLDLIKQIRAAKIEFKEAQRAFSKLELEFALPYWELSKEQSTQYWAALSLIEKARNKRSSILSQIEESVAERQAGREEAQRQWLASRLPCEQLAA